MVGFVNMIIVLLLGSFWVVIVFFLLEVWLMVCMVLRVLCLVRLDGMLFFLIRIFWFSLVGIILVGWFGVGVVIFFVILV